MDDKRIGPTDAKRPPQKKETALPKLQTPNAPTDDVKNTNSTNEGGDLQFDNNPRTIPQYQNGCCKLTVGTRESLYIDQRILKESKTKQKNLAIAWIDNKKAYDLVPQSWIIDCLKMYKISGEVIKFTDYAMDNWKVEVIAGEKS